MKRELKKGFESPTQRFESLYLEFWWIRLGDSNLRDTDSNPSAKIKAEDWRSEESDSNLRVTNSNPSWRKIQISLRRFESLTQRFESLLAQNSNLAQAIRIPYTAIRIPLGAKFKSRLGDSNPLHSDSNPWLCRSIKCATCNSIYPIFKSNLSHNS